jgi:hypothetical protein
MKITIITINVNRIYNASCIVTINRLVEIICIYLLSGRFFFSILFVYNSKIKMFDEYEKKKTYDNYFFLYWTNSLNLSSFQWIEIH